MSGSEELGAKDENLQRNLQVVPLRFADYKTEESFFFQEIIQPWGERINNAAKGTLPLTYSTTTNEISDLLVDIQNKRYDIVRLSPRQAVDIFPALEVFQLPFIASSAFVTSKAMQAFIEEQEANFHHLPVIPLLTFSDGYGLLQLTNKSPDPETPFETRLFLTPSRVTTIFLEAMGAKTELTSPFTSKVQMHEGIDGILASAFYDEAIRPSIVSYYNFGRRYNPSANPYMLLLSRELYLNLHPTQQNAIMNHSRMNLANWVGKRYDLAYDQFLSQGQNQRKAHVMDEETFRIWQRIGSDVSSAWVEAMLKKEIPADAILAKAKELIQKHAIQ